MGARRFRAVGDDVHRPIMIFVAFSDPYDDDRAAAYERLSSPRSPFRPDIIAMVR